MQFDNFSHRLEIPGVFNAFGMIIAFVKTDYSKRTDIGSHTLFLSHTFIFNLFILIFVARDQKLCNHEIPLIESVEAKLLIQSYR